MCVPVPEIERECAGVCTGERDREDVCVFVSVCVRESGCFSMKRRQRGCVSVCLIVQMCAPLDRIVRE